jgi:hypothetical protein
MVCNSVSLGVFSTFHSRNGFRRATKQLRPDDDVSRNSSLFAAGFPVDAQYPHSFSCFDEVFNVHGLELDCVASYFKPLLSPESIVETSRIIKGGVDLVVPDPKPLGKWMRSLLRESWATRWDACQRVWGENYGPTGQDLNEAFWRTACLDRFYDTFGNIGRLRRMPSVQSPTELRTLFNYHELPQSPDGVSDCTFPPQTQSDVEGLLTYLMRQTEDGATEYDTDFHGLRLSFFITRSGYIGLGHPDMLVGDTIAVLLGGPVPYILRRYNGSYMLVGEW